MTLKPYPLKALLSFSFSPPLCSLSIFISHFSTSQTHHYPSRRHEEESRQVKVSVWWDFENCNLPSGVNVFKIAHTIIAAVRTNGIKGPVHITAFGDILQLSRAKQEALSSTGVHLAHIPRGGKNSADRSLLVDLMYWVSQNPPPAHLFLISGDRDFASVLHRLRMNNYNVLLASPGFAPSVLCGAATIMWNWYELLKGENLTGKHYNQPPDGPYGSWYGHYKVPLEDPFLVVEQPACPQTEELSEGCSDSKYRPVPKAVIKQIRQILNSYPNGISITDLRLELDRNNVIRDKDFYGHKKFSRFLLSMPDILSLQSEGDGRFLARGTTTRVIEPCETSPSVSADPDFRNGENLNVSARSIGDDSLVDGALYGKSTLHQSPEVNAEINPRKVQQSPSENDNLIEVNAEKPAEEVQQTLPVDQKNVEASKEQVSEGHQAAPVLEPNSASEVGFVRKFWQRWFGGVNVNSEVKSHNLPGKHGDSEGSCEKRNNNTLKKCTGVSSERGVKEDCDANSCKVADPVTISSSSNDSTFDNKASVETGENRAGKRSGLFKQIANWFKFWRANQDPDASSDQSCEKLNKINIKSLKPEVFAQDSFWKDMEILVDSPWGSFLVTQSRTREELAENLLKEGPLVLRSLSNTDLLQLVDLLISVKKWIEECPSQTPPFRITKAVEKSPSFLHSHAANGLRSIFMRPPSHANLQPKHVGEKKSQNIPHAGVSSIITIKNSQDRSRCEIIADCQKLVKAILKENPEGYNMSAFRKLFLERYGYPLDIQRLGYKKLASLLEIMPGVKIESNYIIPASMVPDKSSPETLVPKIQENTSHALGNSAGQLLDASTKGDEFDSTWDELGPVSGTSSKKREPQSVIGSKRTVEMKEAHSNYEPSVSDDEFSDADGEISISEQLGRQQKPVINKEDSSLLQILDSWYSSKEGEERKDNSEKSENMIDCSEYHVKPSASGGVGMKTETSLEDCGKRQRPQKSYSFVADPVGNDKDKLINGILGSLKKSSDSSMQA